MATFPERPLGKIVFANNSTPNFKLDRVAAYRRLILRIVINITTLAAAPTYREDALLRLIKNVKITRNGHDVKYSLSSRMMYYIEKLTKGTAPHKIDPPTAVSTTADAILVLMVDFASNKTNEKDVSAILKGKGLDQLDLDIQFGDNTDLASANAPTINLGAAVSFVEIEVKEVVGDVVTADGKAVDVLDSAPLDIREIEREVVLDDSAHSSFDSDTQKENVTPAPANILANLLMPVDSSNNKSNTIITSFKIQREVGSPVRIIERTFNSLREENKTEYAQETLETGIVYLDYLDKLAVGLVNNGNEGDVKYRILKIASTSAKLRLASIYVSV